MQEIKLQTYTNSSSLPRLDPLSSFPPIGKSSSTSYIPSTSVPKHVIFVSPAKETWPVVLMEEANTNSKFTVRTEQDEKGLISSRPARTRSGIYKKPLTDLQKLQTFSTTEIYQQQDENSISIIEPTFNLPHESPNRESQEIISFSSNSNNQKVNTASYTKLQPQSKSQLSFAETMNEISILSTESIIDKDLAAFDTELKQSATEYLTATPRKDMTVTTSVSIISALFLLSSFLLGQWSSAIRLVPLLPVIWIRRSQEIMEYVARKIKDFRLVNSQI